eukprot:6371742-Prymnesium_polylepis.1
MNAHRTPPPRLPCRDARRHRRSLRPCRSLRVPRLPCRSATAPPAWRRAPSFSAGAAYQRTRRRHRTSSAGA